MLIKKLITILAIFFQAFCLQAQSSGGHDIIFCGERIPVDDQFVADKLMNVIRKQMHTANMPELRLSTKQYFSIIESYLQQAGLPQDFKYIPIVESGFRLAAVSKANAVGFWQMMPETATDWGLQIGPLNDERNNIYKATQAACKELARNYLAIKKQHKISSWVLTAASYNHGVGNMIKAVKSQGSNYFQMKLNPETAMYVYKIIAIKELFEYPELYMKNFGYNVFNTRLTNPVNADGTADEAFSSMTLKVDEKDGSHPEYLDMGVVFDKNKIKNFPPSTGASRFKFVQARLTGKYGQFNDGDLVAFELVGDMQVGNNFIAKGTLVQWRGWKIDERVYIDLGYGHNVILYDFSNKHGLQIDELNKKEKDLFIIRINTPDD